LARRLSVKPDRLTAKIRRTGYKTAQSIMDNIPLCSFSLIHSPMATLLLLTVTLFFPFVLSATSYDNDFINPDLIVGKEFDPRFAGAQETVVQWAEELAAQGPWCKRPYFSLISLPSC
jgi:hypothetical protein